MEDIRETVQKVVRQVILEMLSAEPDALDQWSTSEKGRRPLVAANWKMNLLSADARRYATEIEVPEDNGVEIVICPPHILLPVLRRALGEETKIRLGAQDMHHEESGAHTGEHSGAMISDAGARYVIVGHSERRAAGEGDEEVRQKVSAALATGLRPVLCVGELLPERQRGATLQILRNQLTLALGGLAAPAPDPDDLVVAYEPVWAIGTGKVATAKQAGEALAFIRDRAAEIFSHAWAERVRLLYGGSVNADNAEELFGQPDVDGFLVGGASLDPAAMGAIVTAVHRARAAVESAGA